MLMKQKKQRSKGGVKSKLNQLAHELSCSPSDYLVLMTDYRYHNAMIQTDYVSQLQQELLEKYPDGNTSNIRRENPGLYFKLQHLYRYSPEEVGMADINSLFNLYNKRSLNIPYSEVLDEQAVIDELVSKYQEKSISNLTQKDPTLYYKISKCAASKNQTVQQWLKNIPGLVLDSRQIQAVRLSHTKVDAKKREQELHDAMNSVRQEYKFPTPENKCEEYYQRKRIAQLALEKINENTTSIFSL